MKLTNPTDAELNAAFAEKVAGWTWKTFPDGVCPDIKHWSDEFGNMVSVHWPKYSFTTSADAVLPWLEKQIVTQERGMLNEQWRVQLWKHIAGHGPESGCPEPPHLDIWIDVYADTFAKAAVIALLRAHGVELEFTP